MPPVCHTLCVQYANMLVIPHHMGFYYCHFTRVQTKGRKAEEPVHGPVGNK